MIIPKTGGNPNVYGGLWNHALGAAGCLGCSLGSTTTRSVIPLVLIAGVAYWLLKKRKLA